MSFRNWTGRLRRIQGDQPLWPWLLGMMLDEEFDRLSNVDKSYERDVFKDRDDHENQEGISKLRLVPALYHHCLQHNGGCLEVDGERIWLLGYEWPNQGGRAESGRRADLVGLRKDGSLVVFECKRADNADPPLTAIVEGLDYLACLLRPGNFEKITSGFQQWIDKQDKIIPEGFEGIKPVREARPSIIVLAPEEYFKDCYSNSHRGDGWTDISIIGSEMCQNFSIQFVSSEYNSHQALKI
ncbi:MAG: hypothetical protein JKY95_14470 [Planctomycetaceae bacterium]|nr:hypothetical protein [Planctomycetaceae bacterium]